MFLKCGPAAGRGTPLAGPKHHGPGGRIGPAGPAHGAKRHLLNTVETSFEPSLNQPMKCGPARVEGPPSQGPNTMALEDGSGPRATSWCWFREGSKPWFLRCSEGDVWHRGLLARGPDPSSRAMVFGPCEGGPSTRAGPHFMGWFREGSKLVSTVFRR